MSAAHHASEVGIQMCAMRIESVALGIHPPRRKWGRGMTDVEITPSFLLNLRLDEGETPIVVSCSIVGDTYGFRGVVRRFKDCKALEQELGVAGLRPERYTGVLSSFVSDVGKTKSFSIDLNEAQKLSVIQIDSPE